MTTEDDEIMNKLPDKQTLPFYLGDWLSKGLQASPLIEDLGIDDREESSCPKLELFAQ